MKTEYKQRIIGGIVLLALIAIFLPFLFYNSTPTPQLSLVTDAPKPPEEPILSAVNAAEVQPPQPQVQSEPVSDHYTAWCLQVGSFSNQENADKLVNELRANHFDVYTKTDQKIIKVYVGPEIDKNKLSKLQDQLKQKFNLTGIIVEYR